MLILVFLCKVHESVFLIELYSREISINSDITEGRLALPFIKHQFQFLHKISADMQTAIILRYGKATNLNSRITTELLNSVNS